MKKCNLDVNDVLFSIQLVNELKIGGYPRVTAFHLIDYNNRTRENVLQEVTIGINSLYIKNMTKQYIFSTCCSSSFYVCR